MLGTYLPTSNLFREQTFLLLRVLWKILCLKILLPKTLLISKTLGRLLVSWLTDYCTLVKRKKYLQLLCTSNNSRETGKKWDRLEIERPKISPLTLRKFVKDPRNWRSRTNLSIWPSLRTQIKLGIALIFYLLKKRPGSIKYNRRNLIRRLENWPPALSLPKLIEIPTVSVFLTFTLSFIIRNKNDTDPKVFNWTKSVLSSPI